MTENSAKLLEDYSLHFPSINKNRLQKAKKIADVLQFNIPSLKNCIVADLGCSNGIITSYIAYYVKYIQGFDLDISKTESMTFPDNCSFSKCDILRTPLSDQSVDLVICNHVYYWFEKPELLVREITRILKPGGHVYFSGPTRFSLLGEQDVIFAPILPKVLQLFWVSIFNRKKKFFLNYKYPRQILRLFSDYKLIPIFPFYLGVRFDSPATIKKVINVLSGISPTAVYLFIKAGNN